VKNAAEAREELAMAKRHAADKFSGLAPRPVERILAGVALDGSDERVLGAAGAVALATGARLTIVHATEPVDGEWLLEEATEPTPDARARLASTVARLVPRGVRHTLEVLAGPAHRVMAEVAARTAPDLVVVGASAQEGRLLGSTAERFVRKATVPVLVVRGDFASPRRVLAPVDLSDLSASGFHCGIATASRLAAGAELQVVSLFAVGFLDAMSKEMREQRWTVDEMTAQARRRMDQLVGRHLPNVPLTCENRVVLGPARESILGAAKQESADLIVMSTHGYGGFERLVLGSVAATVVREAPCSVLLVPPDAAFGDELAEAILSQTAPAKTA
jgi:nucleotide-binding universal stress UspA family protein